jgi:hypothetical protein
MSDSRESTAACVGSMRFEHDPLLQAEAALVRMEEDVFYEVSFHETNKPLGVVLERSGEWAIVRFSTGQ